MILEPVPSFFDIVSTHSLKYVNVVYRLVYYHYLLILRLICLENGLLIKY